MAKRLFLMRHAVTDYNAKRVWTGHLDIDIITPHPRIRHPPGLDLIISSTATRCQQTIDLLESSPRVISDPQFIECGYGKYTGEPKNRELFRRSFLNTPECNDKFIGESQLTGGLRAFRRYQQIVAEEELYDKNVMIVSHKNTLCGFWVLFHLERYFKSIGETLDLTRVHEVSSKLIDVATLGNPVPSPFVNTEPYELMRKE